MNHEMHILYATSSNKLSLSRNYKKGTLVRITRGVYANKSWYDSISAIEKHIAHINICVQLYPDIIIVGISLAILHGLTILNPNENLSKVEE
ncbi:MAG: hypothetical protein LBN22_12015, partial [Clostridiales Family XIII bacterium]|nr:hypothetical protein [Clostridiales Family XIII bacterium]